MKISFILTPFLLMAVCGFLSCVAIPRLRELGFRVLIAPAVFGACSICGIWIGIAVCASLAPRFSVLNDGSVAFLTVAGSYLVLGISGAWLADRFARRVRSKGVVIGTFGAVFIALLCVAVQVGACISRGRALETRRLKLLQEARQELKVGATKDGVARFLIAHGMQPQFGYGEASGTVITSGCAPFLGCGDDSAILELRVRVDSAGTVTTVPEVVALYTDCL